MAVQREGGRGEADGVMGSWADRDEAPRRSGDSSTPNPTPLKVKVLIAIKDLTDTLAAIIYDTVSSFRCLFALQPERAPMPMHTHITPHTPTPTLDPLEAITQPSFFGAS
ncbi:unnamed protein product [Pleuronectes platessa]|uniref:Uncharacterized protein n=1 Tax=Pleuronectes platessa TaxID=8262 RepID=A0A9N7VY58_PLEPL|nr:unnamed protein product [Pleuronectes platessa]